MTTNNKPTSAEVTADMIEQWKSKHGKLTKYTTTDGKVVYFRSPDRAEISATAALAKDKDGIASNQFLANTCALGGDVEIITQEKYLYGLGKHLERIVDKVEGELEEL